MKRVPLRTCIGCREVKPKSELMRLVCTSTGEVKFDPSGKISGRGVYFCPKKECFEVAVKKKRIPWALRVSLTQSEIAELEKFFTEQLMNEGHG